jgi:hypothetical protein
MDERKRQNNDSDFRTEDTPYKHKKSKEILSKKGFNIGGK